MYRNAHVLVSVVVGSLMVMLCVGSASAQSQTPGQITQFDPSLNVVDSVITQDSSGNIGIGTTTPAAALDVATGDLNLAGNLLKGGTLFLHNFGSGNTFLGQNAGNLTMTGVSNTGTGNAALQSNMTGNQNTATGWGALYGNSSGYNNTGNGVGALFANFDGYSNTAIGAGALSNNRSGFKNTATGAGALSSNLGGWLNTASGFNALTNNTSGEENAAFGVGALEFDTTGSFNTGVGIVALNQNTTGHNNTAIGHAALWHSMGEGNTAVGAYADVDDLTPNVTNATAIGYFAKVNASNKIRLGNTSVAVIEGQVPYTWTSDKNQKENFQSINGEEVLRKLGTVNISSWNYIGHDPQQFRHYGPVAQEFFAAFGHDAVGTIGTPTTINSGDLEGILMVAVQALEKRTAENAELRTRIETLERLVKGMTVQDR